MLVKVYAAALLGIDATTITIEVNSSRGIKFFLVGLPDSAVKESHERIISALQVNGYKFPTSQIVVNMAPADVRKEGASYDLPLAIGIMATALLINVSSTNSKEFKLCVNSSFKIDTGLFRKATIRSQCSKHVDNEIIETSMP